MRSLHGRMLRYLDEVARAGSIRKAAERLNVAASSINRQILALEEEAGTPLFERLPRTMRLTAAGEALIAHVRRTLHDFDRTQAQIEDLRGLRRGEVSVAMMGGLGAELLAEAAIAFAERRPRVKLIFHRLALPAILSSVREGETDLGLSFGTEEERGLRTVFSLPCPLGAVVAPRHPLAERSAVRLADLVPHRLILPAASMSLRELLESALKRDGLAPQPVVEANEVEVIKRLVVLGQGVALLNRLNIELERRQGELVFLPILDRSLRVPNLRLFRADRGVPSVLASLFAETLQGTLEAALSAQALEPS
ncbi:LysR family transcriptional regulator [Roseomonas sp. OT10]|uniref:LysR family transcriptional regulator n=1 Tax=Roseomonas cutis TaxID=2897332 RepID=UPI001E4DB64C|nr:LysR family transcriptional regulator [Roseomonas sp. OT10]UFN49535.1 LysR family transcriptional regulator [Roseomonas sp. OT10]